MALRAYLAWSHCPLPAGNNRPDPALSLCTWPRGQHARAGQSSHSATHPSCCGCHCLNPHSTYEKFSPFADTFKKRVSKNTFFVLVRVVDELW